MENCVERSEVGLYQFVQHLVSEYPNLFWSFLFSFFFESFPFLALGSFLVQGGLG